MRYVPVCLVTYCMSCKEESGTGGDASPHTEQEESHAALQLQEITSVLMTQVSGESLAKFYRSEHNVHSMSRVQGKQHVAARTPLNNMDCVNHKIVKNKYSIAMSFSPPAQAYTVAHKLDEKSKSVKLPLDDMSVQRDFPQQHVQWFA